MKFRELTASEYEAFARNHPGRYYINSSKMIELKKKNGWKTYYTGVTDEDGNILAAAGFSAVPVARKFHYAYAQRGILCDFDDHELTEFFTEELKKYISAHGMAYLRMDPYVEYQQLDQEGNIAEGGFCRQDLIDYLASLGYVHQGFYTGTVADSQVRYMVVLDIEDKTIEEIVKGFEPNTRRAITRAQKFGVVLKELSPGDLGEFMKLMEFTSEKRHFEDMGEQAYINQMEAFGPDNAKVVISYLDTATLHANISAERKQAEADLAATEAFLAKKPENGKALRRLNEQKEFLRQLDTREKEANEIEAQYGEKLVLSAAYFVIYDDEMYYISSGSYDQFRKYYGPYVIQDWAIRLAKQRNCRRYNFTGTSGVFNETADDYGVFQFKKKLGGRPIELLGEFILVCDEKMNRKISMVNTVRHLLGR